MWKQILQRVQSAIQFVFKNNQTNIKNIMFNSVCGAVIELISLSPQIWPN
jgi:hypothetical protein